MSLNSIVNPDSGLRYIHVIPDDYGAYADVFGCMTSLATRRSWTSVISPAQFRASTNSTLWQDPNNFFVLWDQHAPEWEELKTPRRCRLGFVFAEALAYDESKMLDLHRYMFQRFRSFVAEIKLDVIFVHNESVNILLYAKLINLDAERCPIMTLPLGYDEAAMGRPSDSPYGASDFIDFAFWGSPTPRREVYSVFFEKCLPGFAKLPVAFGKDLLKVIRRSRSALHIAHSLVTTFSTWRSWQCASTFAAMIVEDDSDHQKGGAFNGRWPFMDQHVIKIPALTAENALQVVDDLKNISRAKLLDTAKAAHEEVARKYTVDFIEDNFLTPAAVTIVERIQ